MERVLKIQPGNQIARERLNLLGASEESAKPVYYLSQNEISLIEGIWDEKCDEMLRNLVKRHNWDAPYKIADALTSCVPQDRLNAFKKGCEETEFHVWYNIPLNYARGRIKELGISEGKPKIKECTNCGCDFLESEIHPSILKRIGYKLLFCNDCYTSAFYGIDRGHGDNELDMATKLRSLAVVLENIPTDSFMQRMDLSTLSEEKQKKVIKILL